MQRIAAIDLGTNSIRLAVADVQDDHSLHLIREDKEVIRLGAGETKGSLLQEDAIHRAEVACQGFADQCHRLKAEPVVAVATSAMREAKNGDQVLARLNQASGLDIHVISGIEEGRLIHLGVVHNETVPKGRIVVIDIGGGSAEITSGDSEGADHVESVKAGAIRTEEAYPGDKTGKYDKAALQALRTFARNTVMRSTSHIAELGVNAVYGTSGTTQNIHEIVRATRGDDAPGKSTLRLEDVTALVNRMARQTTKERMALPRINPERADIIVAGAVVLEQILTGLGVSSLTYSNRTLRDGVLLDVVLRTDTARDTYGTTPVRERSVMQMLRRFHGEEDHAENVARLAVALFDESRALGWHSYGPEQEELLRYACLLHDIGIVVAPSAHHKHGHYLVTRAPLAGFHKEETDVIGALVLFHRKSLPKTSNPAFGNLTAADQKIVSDLLPIVRLADALDRSHNGLVKDVVLTEGAKKTADVLAITAGPIPYETWAVGRSLTELPELFERTIVFGSEEAN